MSKPYLIAILVGLIFKFGCSYPTIKTPEFKFYIDTVFIETSSLDEEFVEIRISVNDNPEFKFSNPYVLLLEGTHRDSSKNVIRESLSYGSHCLVNFGSFKSLDSSLDKSYKILKLSGFENKFCVKTMEESLFSKSDTLWIVQVRYKKEGGSQILQKWPIQNKAIVKRTFTRDPSRFKILRDSSLNGKVFF